LTFGYIEPRIGGHEIREVSRVFYLTQEIPHFLGYTRQQFHHLLREIPQAALQSLHLHVRVHRVRSQRDTSL
jgi:hypothetical protein